MSTHTLYTGDTQPPGLVGPQPWCQRQRCEHAMHAPVHQLWQLCGRGGSRLPPASSKATPGPQVRREKDPALHRSKVKPPAGDSSHPMASHDQAESWGHRARGETGTPWGQGTGLCCHQSSTAASSSRPAGATVLGWAHLENATRGLVTAWPGCPGCCPPARDGDYFDTAPRDLSEARRQPLAAGKLPAPLQTQPSKLPAGHSSSSPSSSGQVTWDLLWVCSQPASLIRVPSDAAVSWHQSGLSSRCHLCNPL